MAKKVNSTEANPNHITQLSIENYKSIKKLDINPARINVFIGKPNTGKSNILEALTLLDMAAYGQQYFYKDIIKYKTIQSLFYDNDTENDIFIHSNNNIFLLYLDDSKKNYTNIWSGYKDSIEKLKKLIISDGIKYGDLVDVSLNNSVKFFALTVNKNGKSDFIDYGFDPQDLDYHTILYYIYKELKNYDELDHSNYLDFPNGLNFFSVFYHNKKVSKEISNILKNEYGLTPIINFSDKKLQFSKPKDNDDIAQVVFDWNTLADTLRRYIFYYAAIVTNTNCVLLFEEPESYSYPGYVKRIAQEMIESKTNQFFVTTHSPFILNTLLDEADENEIKIFVTDYKDYQTVCRELTTDELADYYRYGMDFLMALPQV